jgi:UDP-N-acetylmuramoyl-tripeptide--D-alanyl-D-alanine ligase
MLPEHWALVVVADTLSALQKLAAWYRGQFRIPVVGVTGSSGKTTTKDMIAAVLEQGYRVLKTPGNLNSQIGVPQVLLSLEPAHEIAVLELGMNHPGELARLAEIVRPTVGVITNVGPVHLEFLKTLEGVGRAKGELLDYVDPDGWAVLNADDPYVMAQRARTRARLVTFGYTARADIQAVSIQADFDRTAFRLRGGATFHLRIPGEHQVANALAAIGVGQIFHRSTETMQAALAALEPAAMRMDARTVGGLHLLVDAYNANPVSTCAALKTLAAGGGRHIAVLGDMLELGDMSVSAHLAVGRTAAETADLLVTVGSRARDIARGAREAGMADDRMFCCDTNPEAVERLRAVVQAGDYILIKGSRGMKMEEIVAALEPGDQQHTPIHG